MWTGRPEWRIRRPVSEPALGQLAARHHLGDDQAGAMRIGAPPEGLVGDARHRRQKDPVADRDAAYVERLGKFREFRHAQKPSTFRICSMTRQFRRGSATGKCARNCGAFWNRAGFRACRATMRLGMAGSRSNRSKPAKALPSSSSRPAAANAPASADGPKQYRLIGGRPVIAHTIDAFLQHPAHRPDRRRHPSPTTMRFSRSRRRVCATDVIVGPWRRDAAGFGAAWPCAPCATTRPTMVLIHDARAALRRCRA